MRERSGPRSFQAVDIILLHLTCACFPSIKQIQSIIASPRSSTSLFNFLSKRRFFAACCCRSTARSNASFLLSNGMTSFRNNERAPGKKESLLGVHRDEGPLISHQRAEGSIPCLVVSCFFFFMPFLTITSSRWYCIGLRLHLRSKGPVPS